MTLALKWPSPAHDKLPNTLERVLGEGLGEDVCQVVLQGNLLDLQLPLFELLAEPVVLYSEVLPSGCETEGIGSCQTQGSLIVLPDG